MARRGLPSILIPEEAASFSEEWSVSEDLLNSRAPDGTRSRGMRKRPAAIWRRKLV
jgi:hypothetical protein